jgi:hypothetical protein
MADSRRRPGRVPAPATRRPDPAAPAGPGVAREPPSRVVAPRPAPARPGVRVVSGPMFIDTAAGTFQDLRPPPPKAMSRREFEAELDRLVRAYARDAENPGSVRCEGCRRCESCMFCVDCEECYRCTHSRGCRQSTHLTQCVDCVACHDCAYCVSSEHCIRSSYLVLSRACSECTYCFGCVGLAKKDFHILNVKYTRSEYFRIVKSLQSELGLDPAPRG